MPAPIGEQRTAMNEPHGARRRFGPGRGPSARSRRRQLGRRRTTEGGRGVVLPGAARVRPQKRRTPARSPGMNVGACGLLVDGRKVLGRPGGSASKSVFWPPARRAEILGHRLRAAARRSVAELRCQLRVRERGHLEAGDRLRRQRRRSQALITVRTRRATAARRAPSRASRRRAAPSRRATREHRRERSAAVPPRGTAGHHERVARGRERARAGQDLEHQDPERVDIGAVIDAHAARCSATCTPASRASRRSW